MLKCIYKDIFGKNITINNKQKIISEIRHKFRIDSIVNAFNK